VFPGLPGDFKKLGSSCSLLGNTQTIPFIGVGASFFISLVLYLANLLHRYGKLPFPAHIEILGNSLPFSGD
jgi:hypothetical protein